MFEPQHVNEAESMESVSNDHSRRPGHRMAQQKDMQGFG